ncbi:MAG: SDR family oxidoreductase [Bacillaceae bacterium]
MTKVYFVTGFPGFISKYLLTQMIHDHNEIEKIILLVQPSQVIVAQTVLASIIHETQTPLFKFEIIEGDITKADLDLPYSFDREHITHVFHLAAIYDLAVPKDLAYKVNVEGTKNVNAFTYTLPKLERYTYFSTAYVAGRRTGSVYENELQKNQTFKNYYEQTKYEAEIDVQKNMDDIPTTIIRPGIVVGHSSTGDTTKFDGPYFMLRFFDNLRYLPIPYLGKSQAPTNFIPVDFIVKATSFLSHSEKGKGKVFHLTDPNPLNVEEVYNLLIKLMLNKKPFGRIPFSLAQKALSIKWVRQFLEVEKEVLDYFSIHPTYDCTNTLEVLQGTSIAVPSFKEVAPVMVDYFNKNKLDDSKKIRIV